MVPYDEFRDEALAKKRASYVAVAISAVLVALAVATNHKQLLVWLGTSLVAFGSWIVAKELGWLLTQMIGSKQ
jgi:hypothetical protein